MGLAASQGRYLCLTARNADLTYEIQQLSQARLALATESQQISDEYNAAMNNQIMTANFLNDNGENVSQQLTYEILTDANPFSGLGMRVVDLNGNVVVPKEKTTLSATNKNEDVTKNYSSSADFVKDFMSNDTKAEEMGSWDLNKVKKFEFR